MNDIRISKKDIIYSKNNEKRKAKQKSFSCIKWLLMESIPIIPYQIIIIIINCFMSIAGIYTALLSKSLIDYAINKDVGNMWLCLIIFSVITFIKVFLTPLISIIISKSSLKFKNLLQNKIFKHICYSKYGSIMKYHSMNLLTRITSDINIISSIILETIPNLISLIITFVISLLVLIRLSFQIGIIALVSGPLLFIINSKISIKLKEVYKEIQNEEVKYNSFIQETLKNILVVKSFCKEKVSISKLKIIQDNKLGLYMKNVKRGSLSGFSINFYSTFIYFIIFSWGVINICSGKTTYGTLTAILQLYSNVQYPISSIAEIIPQFAQCKAAIERVRDIENIPIEDNTVHVKEGVSSDSVIELKNVTFSYNDDKAKILDGVNLSINQGEIIALVGPSGSGKTTLAKLMLSLLECSEGEVIVSIPTNINMNESIKTNYRELISYIPQGNTLFSGTIEENIRYGNNDVTFDELKEAAIQSCALEFIDKLENGFETLIGENGIGISEGQAQRIAIARALIRKRPILLLDEVTSSLDEVTECKIVSYLSQLSYKPTCIIITHRPAALLICDSIYKLESGQIVKVNLDDN